VGFAPAADPGGVFAATVRPGLPADRAGLRPGDRILDIGGEPLRTVADYKVVAERFTRGTAVTFRIRRAGRPLFLRVSPGVPVRWGPFVTRTLAVLGYLGIALLALRQSLRDLRVRLLLGLTTAVALEFSLPLDIVGHVALSTAALAAYDLLTGIEIALELHLASLLPERPAWLTRRPWIVRLYYLAGLGLGGAACALSLAAAMGIETLPRALADAEPARLEALLIESAVPVWAVALCALLASQALRHPEPRGRHQAGLVLAGALPWLLFLLGTQLLGLAGVEPPDWLQLLEPLVQLFYPAAFFAAIFRYHLFDIELVVRRSLTYTALTGISVLLFYATLGAGSALFSRWLGAGGTVWSASAASLVLGLLFAPLRRAVQGEIDRRFFPERGTLRREGMTGLLRREAILEHLDQELERARRYGRPLSVAMADLDHFKAVNDRHGHLAGDALLRQAAQAIAAELRRIDRVGRYGGEEFLLVLPETGLAGAGSVAEKIRRCIEEMSVPVMGGAAIRATVSIGLASLDELRQETGDGIAARDLIAAADRFLYEAKSDGRNRVRPRVA
jgi:diguanylate cyclase (GGDEF)-like protein